MDFPTQGLQNVDFSGGLGGVFASQNQMDAQAMRAREMHNKDLMNTYQQLQNERYGQETPLTLEKLRGEAMQQRITGENAQRTQETDVQAKIAKNLQGKTEAELGQYAAESEKMVMQLTAAKARLAQGMPPEQIAQIMGIDLSDPAMQQKYGKLLANPAALPGELDRMIKLYQQVGLNSTRHMQDMEKTKAEIKGRQDVANTQLEGTKYTADAHLAAAKAAAAKGTGDPTTDKVLAQAILTSESPTATQAQKEAAGRIIMQITGVKMASNPGAFKPGDPDMSEVTGGVLKPGATPYAQWQALMGNPKAAPRVPEKAAVPTNQADFDTQWAKLKPGQTLTGPDGNTYTKK